MRAAVCWRIWICPGVIRSQVMASKLLVVAAQVSELCSWEAAHRYKNTNLRQLYSSEWVMSHDVFLCVSFQLDDAALKHLQKHCPELMTINMQSCTVRLWLRNELKYVCFIMWHKQMYIMGGNRSLLNWIQFRFEESWFNKEQFNASNRLQVMVILLSELYYVNVQIA